jgi:excisionase family DNA binding protein
VGAEGVAGVTLEAALTQIVETAVAPLVTEVRELRAEVAKLQGEQRPRLVTVAEAAVELRISACTVRRRIADSSLQSRRVGGRVLVNLSPSLNAEGRPSR